MRAPTVLLWLLVWALPASAAQIGLDWSKLENTAAQAFEDPFKTLSVTQLSDLATIVRLRQRLTREDLPREDRLRASARLGLKQASLEEAGLDIDWLLSQRWVVADKRKQAAWRVNETLDGQTVSLKGYFLMAGSMSEQKLLPYLVPEIGMCAHVPPPAPNNLVRLDLPTDTELPEKLFTPLEISGELQALPQSIAARVVDGTVQMDSAWVLKVAELKVLAGEDTAATPSPSASWPRTVQAPRPTGTTRDWRSGAVPGKPFPTP